VSPFHLLVLLFPILFVKKKMVHYDHVLITENLIILLLILLLRNSYPLSLISELLERINKAKKKFFLLNWI